VRQINACGHIFNNQQLELWFRSNVRCPVCRYDIRTNNSVTNENSEPDETNQNNEPNEIHTNIELLNNDILLYDPSNNILFFETTIHYPRSQQ
jgi:hypothetical protein